MNFNPREKVLISFLGIIAIGAIYINLFLMPQLNYINKTKKEIERLEQESKANELIKKAVGGMDSQLKILTQKFRDLREVFPPNINQEELLIVLRDIADESEVFIDNIAFTEPAAAKQNDPEKNSAEGSKQTKEAAKKTEDPSNQTQPDNLAALKDIKITDNKLRDVLKSLGLDDEGKPVDEKEAKKTKEVPDGKAYSLDAKIFAKGSNDQIKSFLSKVEELKNKSSVKEISINKEETGILSVNLTIEFFGIMDRNAGEYSMLADGTWKPLETGNRENIFKTYEGYKGPVVIQEQKNGSRDKTGQDGLVEALKELQKYDVTMGLLPFGDGMSPPTVTISGRRLAAEGQVPSMPVIYGDNKGEEKVDFFFEDKEGKTVCRIKTQNDSYPRKDSDSAGEVQVSGDRIMILIDSLPRKGANDSAGANITITNKSKKKVVVDVRYEDRSKPRVRINKASGDIEVNYK